MAGRGTRLHTARWEAGISTPKMAQLLGVTGETIRKWERGTTRPRPGDLIAWAEITGVDRTELGVPEKLSPDLLLDGSPCIPFSAGPGPAEESGAWSVPECPLRDLSPIFHLTTYMLRHPNAALIAGMTCRHSRTRFTDTWAPRKGLAGSGQRPHTTPDTTSRTSRRTSDQSPSHASAGNTSRAGSHHSR
jgi:transcriptional regulator with XRE-family HTH domain